MKGLTESRCKDMNNKPGWRFSFDDGRVVVVVWKADVKDARTGALAIKSEIDRALASEVLDSMVQDVKAESLESGQE